MDELVPNRPEFAHLRARLAKGQDVYWDDIVKVLKDDFGGVKQGVETLRNSGLEQFGVVHGSGQLIGEAVQTAKLTRQQLQRLIAGWILWNDDC